MPLCNESPSAERPPKLKRTIGLWMLLLGVAVYVLMLWWRGRDTGQDAIPEASAQAQVEAARGRDRVLA
jgi:hypothetical protein